MSKSQEHPVSSDKGLGLRASDNRPNDEPTVASRAIALTSYFLSGALSINFSQFLGTPLYLINEAWYNAWIAFTKQSFGLLTMGLTEAFAPTIIIVSGDKSVRGQIQKLDDGRLKLDFPKRLVLIANHQIYTDWLYLWWMAYCSGMHGRLYIVLKESLKKIPILGWGMQLSQFIFLKREWEQDKPHLAQALQKLNKAADPMWLLLFPEGTNLAADTRARSAKWAAQTGVADTKHLLLPRSTGLRFCLEQLKGTTEYLYDCTVAYEGVARGQFAQDIFTLKAGYIDGHPPNSVSMYWRRFAVQDIPLQDPRVFDIWLTARWREKDLLMENYLRFGRFPSDTGASTLNDGKVVRGCGRVKVQIKSSHWYEFLQIFAPMGVLAMVLYVFYGALPQKIWKAIKSDALSTSANNLQTLAIEDRSVSGSFDLDSMFDRSRQGKTFQDIGHGIAAQLRSQEFRSVIERAGLVQKWLEDPQKFLNDNLSNIGESQSTKSFVEIIREEEQKRKDANNPNPHQGTFWRDLEASRRKLKRGMNVERKPAIESRKKESSSVSISNDSLTADGAFWQRMREEEKSRREGEIAKPSRKKPAPTQLKHRPTSAPSSIRSKAKRLAA